MDSLNGDIIAARSQVAQSAAEAFWLDLEEDIRIIVIWGEHIFSGSTLYDAREPVAPVFGANDDVVALILQMRASLKPVFALIKSQLPPNPEPGSFHRVALGSIVRANLQRRGVSCRARAEQIVKVLVPTCK